MESIIEQLQKDCEYSDGTDDHNGDGGVDYLIAYKDALEDRVASTEHTLAEKLKEAEEYIATYDVPYTEVEGGWLDESGAWKDWESEAEARAADGTRGALAFALAALRGEKSS